MLAGPASATHVYDVNSTADLPNEINDGHQDVCHTAPASTECTLRAALMAAQYQRTQTGFEPNVINVPAGTYTLTIPPGSGNCCSGLAGTLLVTGNTTINGAGVGKTIIDANQLDRALTVTNDSSTWSVTISNLTVRNGKAQPNEDGAGGGLWLAGSTLTLDHVVVENSASPSGGYGGGCIFNAGGVLKLVWSTLRGCTSASTGGGLSSEGNDSIDRSLIVD